MEVELEEASEEDPDLQFALEVISKVGRGVKAEEEAARPRSRTISGEVVDLARTSIEGGTTVATMKTKNRRRGRKTKRGQAYSQLGTDGGSPRLQADE